MNFREPFRFVFASRTAADLPPRAPHPGRQFARADLSGISAIEVLRPVPRPIEVKTASGGTAMILGGPVTGGPDAQPNATGAQEAHPRVQLPDFGESLARNLAGRAPKELPGWPKTMLARDGRRDRPADGAATLSLEIANPFLTVVRGLTVAVTGLLKDADRGVLWSKYFWYRSYDFGGPEKQEDYLENDCALLKQEVEFAARQTATALLHDIKQRL